jgi:hypothetical protein
MVLFEHREGILGKDQGGVKVKSSRIDHGDGRSYPELRRKG